MARRGRQEEGKAGPGSFRATLPGLTGKRRAGQGRGGEDGAGQGGEGRAGGVPCNAARLCLKRLRKQPRGEEGEQALLVQGPAHRVARRVHTRIALVQ